MNDAQKEDAGSMSDPLAESELKQNWRILIPSFVGVAFSMSTIATIAIGPFIKPLGDEMGWSRTAIQTSLLFGQGFSSIGVIATGILLDKIGLRRAAIIGLLGAAAGLALLSLSQTLTYYYFIIGLTALVGSGASAITWSRAITAKFDRSRGFALSLALAGAGITGIMLPVFLVAVIAGHGWRTAYLALAGLPGLIALPLVFMLFRPGDVSPKVSGLVAAPLPFAEILGDRRFWALLILIPGTYFAITGIVANFIPMLTDKGLAAESAAIAQGAYGAAFILGRLAVGILIDRFWAPAVGAMFLAPAAISCFLLTGEPTFATAALSATLVGMAAGAELDLLAFLLSRYFRPGYFARAYSYIYATVACAGATGPLIFARVQQITGHYDIVLFVAAGLFVFGAVLLLTLGQYPASLMAPANPTAPNGRQNV